MDYKSNTLPTEPHETQNYKWFGYKRCLQKKNVKKGVGIFVKDIVIKNYTVDIIEKNVDCILDLKFVSKSSEFSFVLSLVTYLQMAVYMQIQIAEM